MIFNLIQISIKKLFLYSLDGMPGEPGIEGKFNL